MPSNKKSSPEFGESRFLSQPDAHWHASLPSDLRQALREGDLPVLWKGLGQHFQQRDGLRHFGEDVHALSMAAGPRSIETVQRWWEKFGPLLEAEGEAEPPTTQQLESSLIDQHDTLLHWQEHGEKEWLLVLAHVRAMPLFVPKVAPECWFGFLESLLSTIEEAASLSLGEMPLGRSLLVGETGWTLGCLFPEMIPCRKAQAAGREDLELVLEELLDGAGLPHAEDYPLLRPLLASWTRCLQWGDWIGKRPWRKKFHLQYEWAVNHLLRFSRPEGLPVFGPAEPSAEDFQSRTSELLHAALSFIPESTEKEIASVACPWYRKKGKKQSEAALPEVTYHSEWAAIAYLRSGWDPKEPALAVSYYPMRDPFGELAPAISAKKSKDTSDRSVLAELRVRSQTFLSGPWEITVKRGGKTLAPITHWEETCWMSDEDIDYLELEMLLEEDVRVQRHFMLAHDDEFVWMADAVLGHESPPRESSHRKSPLLEYTAKLPLTSQVECLRDEEATEIDLLSDDKQIARLLPLALSEWKSDAASRGMLEATESHLVLKQRTDGNALFAPLFFDLKKKRLKKEYTWRKLTVGEKLEILPEDQAVGYRVRSHHDQWLFYRSLVKPDNRTVLGQNLVSELMIGRFDENGEIELLLQIE